MPINYSAVGYGAYLESLHFWATGSPNHILAYKLSDFLQGTLNITEDHTTVKDITPHSMTRAYGNYWPWAIATQPGGAKYVVLVLGGSNEYQYNLPPIGPTDSLTSIRSTNPFKLHAVARIGSGVFEHVNLDTTWSPVASLNNAGTSNWKGIAMVKWDSTLRRIFTQATINGGASGIVEQYWPNAIPSMAGPPVIVYSGTDLVPFGISSDGCELYTSRTTASGLEVVVLKR